MKPRTHKPLGRNKVADMANQYMQTRMGITASCLVDQEANFHWRHLWAFGMRVLRAERRRRSR